MNKNIAFLASGDGKKARDAVEFLEKHNLEGIRTIFIVSDDINSQTLKWAAKNRIHSLCVNFDKIIAIKSENKVIGHELATSKKMHTLAERSITSFIREHDIKVVLLDGFCRKLSMKFKKDIRASGVQILIARRED